MLQGRNVICALPASASMDVFLEPVSDANFLTPVVMEMTETPELNHLISWILCLYSKVLFNINQQALVGLYRNVLYAGAITSLLQHIPSTHGLSCLIDTHLAAVSSISQSFDLHELWEWANNAISIETLKTPELDWKDEELPLFDWCRNNSSQLENFKTLFAV